MCGKHVEKLKLSYTADGKVKWTVWGFFKNLNRELPYETEVLLLGIYISQRPKNGYVNKC